MARSIACCLARRIARCIARPTIVTFAFAVAVATCVLTMRAQTPSQPQSQPARVTIERLALHQFEDGPVLASSYEFVPGETAYFSCRITGYHIVKNDQQQSVKLTWQMRMLDPSGVPIEKDRSGRIEDQLLPQDKSWVPKFLTTFVVPAFAPGGTYRITVKVADEAGNTEATGELAFAVRGHSVQSSDTLLARNFLFLRSEDDRRGMSQAVYHPGETLWARFDITGYKFGEGNRFSVDYGLAVLRATGEQLFAQPAAAADSNQSFYPQRYVPGMLSLTLDQNVPKGSFLLVVTVRDKIGDQSWETRQPFQIE
jgi:hypothetical protein